jgi:hypothetical protein
MIFDRKLNLKKTYCDDIPLEFYMVLNNRAPFILAFGHVTVRQNAVSASDAGQTSIVLQFARFVSTSYCPSRRLSQHGDHSLPRIQVNTPSVRFG